MNGVKEVLENGEKVRLDDLQLVVPPVEEETTANAIELADRERKIERTIKHREGLSPEDAAPELPGKRYNLRPRAMVA